MPCAVFFDSGAESHAYVVLEESADEAGERLSAAQGLARFLTKHGHPIWINPAAVRFIEEFSR